MTKTSNRILEALPERLDAPSFFSKMKLNPPFSKHELPKSDVERKTILNQLLHNWFHVNAQHFDIYERLADIISEGYRVRGEYGFQRTIENTIDWNKNSFIKDYTPKRIRTTRPVEGFSVLGISGVGKSVCVESILNKCFRQTIKHDYTTQITFLKINCTSIGSLKALCHSFFHAVDELIGTNDFERHLAAKYTAEKMLPIIANIAARHHLGALIIDEINHLADVNGQSQNQIMNFLKNLNECIGLPIVYIGTPEAAKILMGNFQQARRTQGIGSVVWNRYSEEDEEWQRVMKELWKYQVLKKPGLLSESLIHTYYDLSQGILDPLVKLHVAAQKRAISLGLETIDEGLLRKTSKDDFSFTSPMLDAIRVNDPSLLKIYTDVSINSINILNELEASEPKKDKLSVTLSELFEKDFTPEEIQTVIDTLIQNNPNTEQKYLKRKSIETLTKVKSKIPRKKSRPKLATAKGDVKRNYDLLKNDGTIKAISRIK